MNFLMYNDTISTGLHIGYFKESPIEFLNYDVFFFNEDGFKPSVLFVGHRQTVQTQIRRRILRRLIRVSTVCSQNVLLEFE